MKLQQRLAVAKSRLYLLLHPLLYPILHPMVQVRNRHFFLFDLMAFALSPALALYLRTDKLSSLHDYADPLLFYTGLAMAVRILLFYGFGIYRRYWRFASSIDLAQLTIALFIAAFILISANEINRTYVTWLLLPRSLPLLDTMISFLASIALRSVIRLAESWRASAKREQHPVKARRVLIVGAGYTGALLAREIRNNAHIHMQLVGFIDDNPNKQGIEMHGARILGSRDSLAHLVHFHHIDRVLIAMPEATGSVLREIVAVCHAAGITALTVPGLHEVLNGSVSVSHLRNIQIEDLLRREVIQTDIAAVTHLLQGKRVLITGGGGSIGSEICRQILRSRPAQLILLGHGENSVFETTNELRRLQIEWGSVDGALPGTTIITPLIADLRFQERVLALCKEHRPQVIFHAAAHKHVPLMETNPVEAITNNILGTKILLSAARQVGVDRFVMISTDKAVNPTSVMGASKRAAELLVLEAARSTGRFYQVVRFGNVLGSRGSVLHTFKQQIASGGPVTVTHPDMIRYFMTIPEAVQLVLQASVSGQGGEVLMLDMGNPVRVVDLAQDMITLSGLQVGSDIEIEFTGLRPGEKLFEEMFTPNESYGPTQHAKVLVARNASQFIPADLSGKLEQLIGAALKNDSTTAIRLLHQLLPEYRPSSVLGEQVKQSPATESSTGDKSSDKSKVTPTLARQPILSHYVAAGSD